MDAGLPRRHERIRAAAEARFGRGAKPEAILLTHGHFDHYGSARALATYWDVPVYAHPLEVPFLTGKSMQPPGDPTPGASSPLPTASFPTAAPTWATGCGRSRRAAACPTCPGGGGTTRRGTRPDTSPLPRRGQDASGGRRLPYGQPGLVPGDGDEKAGDRPPADAGDLRLDRGAPLDRTGWRNSGRSPWPPGMASPWRGPRSRASCRRSPRTSTRPCTGATWSNRRAPTRTASCRCLPPAPDPLPGRLAGVGIGVLAGAAVVAVAARRGPGADR